MKIAAILMASIFFIALFFLTLLISALRRQHRRESKTLFKLLGKRFFYRPLLLFFFPKDDYEGILFSAIVAQNIARFLVISAWTMWLYLVDFGSLGWVVTIPLIFLMIVLFFACGDYIPRVMGSKYPVRSTWIGSIISSPFLILAFPVTYLFIQISQAFWHTLNFEHISEPMGAVKQEIFEILQEAKLTKIITPHDRKLIAAVASFQNRIVREVMVPRIDIFSLNASTTIQEAARQLEEQGYSRVPVYKENIDQIVGVLMYKEILTKYMEYQRKDNDLKVLQAPIETILKTPVYTPETKKISNLLQEFRKKQVHFAIVVDEYGGTEGIVTIEDILEEIVGDIEDEYDEEEELYTKISDGSWIADARMSIFDAEEQLGVHIPQEGDYDYDTLGGYIFQRAGAIPSKGFTIKLDDVELEVLKSNDRRIEKVKIKRTQKPEEKA